MDSPDTSLGKGLRLFRLIAEDRGRTPFRSLVERAGIPPSTAHRLLRSMRNQGLVGQVGAGRYDIGLELVDLCDGRSRNEHLANVARHVLNNMARRLGLTVHLGVLEDAMVTYLVKSEGKTSCGGANFTREGMQLEAYCSAVGRVLLAGLEEKEQDAYLSDGPFVDLTARTITCPTELHQIIKTVSAHGFAKDDREIADDLLCFAVPLRSGSGEVVAGISVSLTWPPDNILNEQELVRQLEKVSRKITARL